MGETQDRRKKPLSNLPQKLAFLGEILEAPIRIELMHKGFADLTANFLYKPRISLYRPLNFGA
jgi:hypothetical protein